MALSRPGSSPDLIRQANHTQAEIVFTIIASVARFESILFSEQVKAAIARTKAQDKPAGCLPLVEAAVQEKIR